MVANRPAGSWGTSQAYWAALPSTKPSSVAGPAPARKRPSAKRGWTVRCTGSTSRRQFPRPGAERRGPGRPRGGRPARRSRRRPPRTRASWRRCPTAGRGRRSRARWRRRSARAGRSPGARTRAGPRAGCSRPPWSGRVASRRGRAPAAPPGRRSRGRRVHAPPAMIGALGSPVMTFVRCAATTGQRGRQPLWSASASSDARCPRRAAGRASPRAAAGRGRCPSPRRCRASRSPGRRGPGRPCRVAPVGVRDDVGVQERVVEGGVEADAIGTSAAADVDRAQRPPPARTCGAADRREAAPAALGAQIRARAGHAREGDADPHLDGPPAAGVEGHERARLGGRARVARQRRRAARDRLVVRRVGRAVERSPDPRETSWRRQVPCAANGRSKRAAK